MLFQVDIYDIMDILRYIIIFFQVPGSIGLVIAGTSQIRRNDKIIKPILFTIVGVIVTTYLAIEWPIWFIIYRLAHDTEMWVFMVQNLLVEMIPNIISLITFGVLFLLLGIKNKQNHGKRLMYSGIFWIAFAVIVIPANSIILYSYLPGPFSIELLLTALIMPPIASIFMVTASIFFVIYATKLKFKILLCSSLFLLLASSVFTINSLLRLITYFL